MCASLVISVVSSVFMQHMYVRRFFCDCGAGALSCDCLLTGLKAHSCSNLKAGSNNHQLGGAGPHASPSSNELSNSVPS